MSCVLIESQIFYRQPYLTQSISILSYGPCVFEFFWRSENASMAAFAPFRVHFSKSQWFHAIHLESQWSVFERVYWKIHDQKCSFSLKPKKMLIGILKWYSRKTFPLGQLTWIVEFDVGMITFIAHFWKRKLDLIRQQNVSTRIDQYVFLAGSFVFFRHYDSYGPHSGLFPCLSKKLGAGPYGLYAKISHYSKVTISGANDFSRTC